MVENLISIIIPVYNIKMNYLESCIDSILQQTYCQFEIVIVDDGSCRKCAAALENIKKNHTAEFQMIRDEKQREGAKGSKYMQSKPGDIYWEAYRWLMENPEKELLFVGMGCQSDGFRKFSEIKGIRDQVYIVDIICHGYRERRTEVDHRMHRERDHDGAV